MFFFSSIAKSKFVTKLDFLATNFFATNFFAANFVFFAANFVFYAAKFNFAPERTLLRTRGGVQGIKGGLPPLLGAQERLGKAMLAILLLTINNFGAI